jgi:hypothetical protein
MLVKWGYILILLLLSNHSYSQSGIINGRVYCQFNKAPLTEAKLILIKNNKYFKKTKTDHSGNYWFGELKKANYSIWVIQKGYCHLEMSRIECGKNEIIDLDLGLTTSAINSNVATESKVYKIYSAPTSVELTLKPDNYLSYKDDINILSEVYRGNDISISPKVKDPAPEHRATHYNESLRSLERSPSIITSGY